jgi:hypothetical protein
MGLAGERIEPITQTPIEALDMHGSRVRNLSPNGGLDFHRLQSTVFIAMLDRLCQANGGREDQGRPAAFPGSARLTILTDDDRRISAPSIAAPIQRTPMGALHGLFHRMIHHRIAYASIGVGDDKSARSILDETSPSLASIGLLIWRFFFWTKDQNSSISTCSTWIPAAKLAVMASAWSAANRSHFPIVSYLWPVASSAPRKLPRRMTMNNAEAISLTSVFRSYSGVPSVSPKYRPHPRQ